jgi:Spy/CpxP family protein refolding chaperone
MRNGIRATVLGLVLALSVGGGLVLAHSKRAQAGQTDQTEHSGKGNHRHGDRMQAMAAKLGLTDAQKAQMKQIRAGHKDAMTALRTQLKAKSQDMRKANASGTFDVAAATQRLTEIAPIKAQLMAERFKEHQEMQAVLTPDQKAKLEQMHQQFKAKHAERHGTKGD